MERINVAVQNPSQLGLNLDYLANGRVMELNGERAMLAGCGGNRRTFLCCADAALPSRHYKLGIDCDRFGNVGLKLRIM